MQRVMKINAITKVRKRICEDKDGSKTARDILSLEIEKC